LSIQQSLTLERAPKCNFWLRDLVWRWANKSCARVKVSPPSITNTHIAKACVCVCSLFSARAKSPHINTYVVVVVVWRPTWLVNSQSHCSLPIRTKHTQPGKTHGLFRGWWEWGLKVSLFYGRMQITRNDFETGKINLSAHLDI